MNVDATIPARSGLQLRGFLVVLLMLIALVLLMGLAWVSAVPRAGYSFQNSDNYFVSLRCFALADRDDRARQAVQLQARGKNGHHVSRLALVVFSDQNGNNQPDDDEVLFEYGDPVGEGNAIANFGPKTVEWDAVRAAPCLRYEVTLDDGSKYGHFMRLR